MAPVLDFDDPRWNEMKGGYRLPYDPRPVLLKLRGDSLNEEAWTEFWGNLHHQGDVDIASYATIPQLVAIFRDKKRNEHFYALIAAIEVQRHKDQNPALPGWIEADYAAAMQGVLECAAEDILNDTDEELLHSILAAIAAAKGEILRAELMGSFGTDELEEMLDLYWRDGSGVVGNLKV